MLRRESTNRWCRWFGHRPITFVIASKHGVSRHVRCTRCDTLFGSEMFEWDAIEVDRSTSDQV